MKPALPVAVSLVFALAVQAQTPKPAKPKAKAEPEVPCPPVLPGGKEMVTDTSPEFLQSPHTPQPRVQLCSTMIFVPLPG